MTNIALDLVGQARTMLQYAAELKGGGTTEDTLAYHRDASEYTNLLICEQPNGDFGNTMARHFLFDVYHNLLLQRLLESNDETIRAYAEKCIKEVAYHLGHSSDWILRLGDGTEESHSRIQNAINEAWQFTDELFETDEVDEIAAKEGFGTDASTLKESWMETVTSVLNEATLTVPTGVEQRSGGRKGEHTEHLTEMLAEMQELPRRMPEATW